MAVNVLIAMSFTKLRCDFCLIYSNNQMENIPEHRNLHACNSNSPKKVPPHIASSPSFQLTTPYVSSNYIGCNLNLEKPHWLN